MLLSIKINGKEIVLQEDFSFAISRENPIFNDPETLAGDYIESMTFPMKGNRDIFQNMNRIENRHKEREFDISIFYNNYHLISGTFTVKSAGADFITGDAKLNALSFFNKIKDLKLTDIEDNEVFFLGFTQNDIKNNITRVAKDLSTYFDYPFRFPPMINDEFYDEIEGYEYREVINQFFNYIGGSGVSFHKISTTNDSVVLFPVVPCFYLNYIIKTLAKSQAYTITLPTHSLFEKLILANNKSLDYENDYYNSLLAKGLNPNYEQNKWVDFTFTEIIKDPLNMLQGDTTQLKIKKKGIFKIRFDLKRTWRDYPAQDYKDKVRVILTGSQYTHFDLSNNQYLPVWLLENYTIKFQVHLNNDIPHRISGEIQFIDTDDLLPLYNMLVYTNKHVPAIEQLKLFTILKGLFNAGFYADDEKHEIEMITFNEIIGKSPVPLNIKMEPKWNVDKSKMGIELKYDNSYPESEHPDTIQYEKSSFAELPTLANIGDYAHVINEGSIYFYSESDDEDTDEGWELFNVRNKERKIEEDDMVSFDIPFDIPNMNQTKTVEAFTAFTGKYLMPQTQGKGASFLNKKTDTDDFTILVYHGMQEVQDLINWSMEKSPLASITKYDGLGHVIHPDHSLLLDDIEKNFYRSFINFLELSREVKFTTKMKIADFMKLRLQEKYTAAGYTFLIKSMKMSVGINDYSFVEMVIAVI